MSERVLYFLGAGFSAPLGLPVTRDFLFKSKDLFASDPTRLAHFKTLYDTIEHLHKIKSYFESDLFNIEEILSILEMQSQLEGRKTSKEVIDFICDVISGHTPPFPAPDPYLHAGDWQTFAQVNGLPIAYLGFVANLFGLRIRKVQVETSETLAGKFELSRVHERSARFSVVTLNYDLVLEKAAHFFQTHYDASDVVFSKTRVGDDPTWEKGPYLAKLHGGVDSRKIVPPTWSKAVYEEVIGAWQLAYRLISEANHIRIIGYSLPIADSYVKYLLKAAILKSEHLKKIEVICLDPDQSVEERYRAFMAFVNFRFLNTDFREYIRALRFHRQVQDVTGLATIFDALERFL